MTKIPSVTIEQMREVDKLMVYKEMQREQVFGILGIILLIFGYFLQILWK